MRVRAQWPDMRYIHGQRWVNVIEIEGYCDRVRQTSTVETFRDKSSKSAQKCSVEERAICIYEILKN